MPARRIRAHGNGIARTRTVLSIQQAIVLLAALFAVAGCDNRPFDTGWDRFAPDRRERPVVNRAFDAVAIPLQDRLQRSGMDRLKGAARREPSLFTVESRKVLITHLWLADPESIAPFSPFFSCINGNPVSAAAGTLLVIERHHGTELEFHLAFGVTEDPTIVDACTLRPGLLSRLTVWAGIA